MLCYWSLRYEKNWFTHCGVLRVSVKRLKGYNSGQKEMTLWKTGSTLLMISMLSWFLTPNSWTSLSSAFHVLPSLQNFEYFQLCWRSRPKDTTVLFSTFQNPRLHSTIPKCRRRPPYWKRSGGDWEVTQDLALEDDGKKIDGVETTSPCSSDSSDDDILIGFDGGSRRREASRSASTILTDHFTAATTTTL